MTWFEDDSKGIPDFIKNMSKEQLEADIHAYEEEAKQKKARQKAKPLTA
jgi:hypothetical protein